MKNEKPQKPIANEKPVKPEPVAAPPKPAAPVHRYLSTPDGRYFIARGKLLRCSNPKLSQADREKYSKLLVIARKEVRSAKMWGTPEAVQKAHRKVDAAKQGLGERGDPWWTDGAPDYNRRDIDDTPYAAWWNQHNGGAKKA